MRYLISVEKGISDYYFCRTYENINSPASTHSHFELIFVLDGAAQIMIENNTFTVKKGECVSILPYQVHSYQTPKASSVFTLACPPDYIPEHKQCLTTMLFEPPILPFDTCTELLISKIVDSDFTDNSKKKALLYYTISEFVEKCETKQRNTGEFDVFRRSIAYISEHFKESITLGNVAAHAGVTPSHLSRVLNKGSQSGFSDVLNSLRTYHAKNLLETTDLSVTEIAYESGYNSIRNFNRAFLKHFECTPKEIREKKPHTP